LGDGSLFTNLKGFVNFGPRLGIPSHVITLHDSQPMKTAAQPNKHPSNDVGDVYVGVDSVTEQGVGLALGSPAQVSQYIGNVGDNRNWKERLTANLKSFKVPIWLNGEVFSVSPRSTWNSYLHDGTSAVTFGRFIPDRGITVTRLSAQLLTAPAGCATPGSIIVTDGRTSTTLPLANGALSNDTPPLSQNYAAGSVLTVENTLGTGCSTHAARINVTVEFRTQ
jgi:hypothetical protein